MSAIREALSEEPVSDGGVSYPQVSVINHLFWKPNTKIYLGQP